MSSASKYGLKKVGKESAELLSSIHEECFPNYWNTKELEDMMSAAGTQAWVAGNDAMIICRILHEQAEILTLAVRPKARRQGLALALLKEAESVAAAQQVHRMFLEVGADNEAACGLYTRAGYGRISCRKAYYRREGGQYADALVMARNLP